MKTIEEMAQQAINDNNYFMSDPSNPEIVDRGLEQMRACKLVINHIFSLPLADRLTDKEREKVKAFYNGNTFGELDFIELISCRRVLESIFGSDLFGKEGEE